MCPTKNWLMVLVVLVELMALSDGMCIAANNSAVTPRPANNSAVTPRPAKPNNYALKYIKHLESWMDPNVDPCDNFYRFACGRVKTEQENLYESASLMSYAVFLINFKQNTDDDGMNTTSLQKNVKTLYNACNNVNETQYVNMTFTNNSDFRDFILDHLEGFGGWPVLKGDSWNETAFNWQNTTAKIFNETFWFNRIFPLTLKREKTKFTIEFSEPNFGVSKEILSADDAVNNVDVVAYLESMTSMALLLGADDQLYAKNELKKLLDFEIELARLYNPLTADGSPVEFTPEKFTLEKLMIDFPELRWDDFLKQSFISEIHLELDEPITLLFDCKIIPSVFKLIAKTDERTLANFVAWQEIRWVIEIVENLGFKEIIEYQDSELFEYHKKLLCIKILVGGHLRGVMKSLYVRESLSRNDWNRKVKFADKIFEGVRAEYVKMVNNTRWLSNGTRKIITDKLQSVTYDSDYSDELHNETIFEENFHGLKLNESNFIQSMISLEVFSFRLAARQANKSGINITDKLLGRGDIILIEANANYDVLKNHIRTSLGLFASDNFLDVNLPNYMNYGRFGAIIGHEIGHGLDSTDRIQSGKKGEFIAWWPEYESVQYDYKTKCLDNQYKISFGDIGNSLREQASKTSYEDVADNLGFKMAYLAHKNAKITQAEYQPTLHNKTYNRNQMFWINTANLWCAKPAPLKDSLVDFLTKNQNDHSLHEMRVLGSFMNYKQFAYDFRCPEDSPMNPSSKCTIF